MNFCLDLDFDSLQYQFNLPEIEKSVEGEVKLWIAVLKTNYANHQDRAKFAKDYQMILDLISVNFN
jgi:hypothetical protein